MQASKIKPKQTYAIWLGAGDAKQLVRFKVQYVTTQRMGDSPSEYHSSVTGHIDPADVSENVEASMTISPDKILGPYQEHKELVERKAAEDAARQAASDLRDSRAAAALTWLYDTIGEPFPDVETLKRSYNHNLPFLGSYDGAINISRAGVEKLVATLELPVVKKE